MSLCRQPSMHARAQRASPLFNPVCSHEIGRNILGFPPLETNYLDNNSKVVLDHIRGVFGSAHILVFGGKINIVLSPRLQERLRFATFDRSLQLVTRMPFFLVFLVPDIFLRFFKNSTA